MTRRWQKWERREAQQEIHNAAICRACLTRVFILNPCGAELGRDHGDAGEPRMHWPPGCFGPEATGLILRWMPSSTHPMAPRLHRERIVQVQCMHGGATTICLANNLRAILAPLEVIAPSLVAWIEQTYRATLRVTANDLCAFILISGTARQPKVIRIVRAAGSHGDDMINLQ